MIAFFRYSPIQAIVFLVLSNDHHFFNDKYVIEFEIRIYCDASIYISKTDDHH